MQSVDTLAEPPQMPARPAHAWLFTMGSLAALVIGSVTSMPGTGDIDRALASRTGGHGGLLGLFDVNVPMLPIVNPVVYTYLAFAWLVIGLALGPNATERARRIAWQIAMGLIVLGLAVQGYAIGLWVQSAGSTLEVDAPYGAGWILEATLVWAAGGALAIFVARQISLRGVGQGPLVIAIFSTVVGLLAEASTVGIDVGLGRSAPITAIEPVLRVLPLAAMLAFVGARHVTWPVTILRSMRLTSAADAVGLFCAVSSLTPMLTLNLVVLLQPRPTVSSHVATVMKLVADVLVLAAIVYVTRRAATRGSNVGALVLTVVAPVTSFALVVTSVLVSAHGLPRALRPGPFAGNRSFVVGLAAEGGDGRHDADRMVARLETLRIDAHVERAARDQIELRIERVSSIDCVRQVARRGLIELRAVREPDDPRDDPTGTPCTDEGLEPPAITSANVASADASTNPETGDWAVWVQFDAEGTERFASLTRALVHRKIAICKDGIVLMEPVVQEPITGGRLQITLGAPERRDPAQVEALAAALRSGALSRPWTIESENVARD